MKVVNINDTRNESRKSDLLEVLDEIRAQIESGDIQEFVATTLDKDNETQIHISCLDFHGGVGLFEIGKQMFIQTIEFDGE
jgi:hypothetical protein